MACFNRALELATAKVHFGDADDRRKLQAITHNNIGCYYFRKQLFKMALSETEKALRLEVKSSKCVAVGVLGVPHAAGGILLRQPT